MLFSYIISSGALMLSDGSDLAENPSINGQAHEHCAVSLLNAPWVKERLVALQGLLLIPGVIPFLSWSPSKTFRLRTFPRPEPPKLE